MTLGGLSRIYGGISQLTAATKVVIPWWLSGGIAAVNCIGAYAAKGAADLAGSYKNLANPGTYDLTVGVAPTWDAVNGWIFNGSSQYLKTGIVPAVGWSIITKFSNSNNTGYLFGEQMDASSGFGIAPQRGTGGIVRYLHGTWGALSDVAPALTGGVLAIVSGALSGIGYRNGASEGVVGATFTTTHYQFAIGCRNVAGVYSLFWLGKSQATAIYNSPITPAQVAAVTNAMNAL